MGGNELFHVVYPCARMSQQIHIQVPYQDQGCPFSKLGADFIQLLQLITILIYVVAAPAW